MERDSTIILDVQEEQISKANVSETSSLSLTSSSESDTESAETKLTLMLKSTNYDLELEEANLQNMKQIDEDDGNNELSGTQSSRETLEIGSDYHSCSTTDFGKRTSIDGRHGDSSDMDDESFEMWSLKAEKNEHKIHVKNIVYDDILTVYSYVSEDSGEYRPGGYHPIAVGDCLNQRYYAISKLGWGHYSTVWLCFDTKMQCYSAIKLVKSAEQYADSARHEIRLLRHISQLKYHPWRDRVVNFNNSFTISGVNGTHECLVFDVLGENMLMLIQRSAYRGLPLYNVKQIAKQVLQGLSMLHTHANIIHTDLKPENVLLATDELSMRLLANVASEKYILKRHEAEVQKEDTPDLLGYPKLSKTAKRRLRAKSKKTLGFFQTHRKWLRERGIADLMVLANYELLTPKLAMDAITGKLPFLPVDNPKVMSDEDLLEFEQCLYSVEHVGDMVDESGVGIEPLATGTAGVNNLQLTNTDRRRATCRQAVQSNSKISRLLKISRKKFMEFVQKVVEMEPATSKTPFHSNIKKLANNSRRKRNVRRQPKEKLLPPQSTEPNVNIIHRKDPALEPCQLKAVIADVGNSCFANQHITEDIQTREYRAVEVILGAEYNTSADLWSAACLFWELATGEYLFEPNKYHEVASQDEVHIADIIETCGPIPRELVDNGEYSGDIFKADGELIHIKTLIERPLDQILIERHNWSINEAADFAAFLMPMLATDPAQRVTALEASNHPWLNLDEDASKTYTK